MDKKYLDWALAAAAKNPNFNDAVLPGHVNPADDNYNYHLSYLFGDNPGLNGHLNDIGKKPNHPTFSNESAYAIGGPPSGKWIEPLQGDNWLFNNPSRGLNYAPEQQAYQPQQFSSLMHGILSLLGKGGQQ